MDITPSFVVCFCLTVGFFPFKLFIDRLQNKFSQPNTWNWHYTEIQQLWVNLTVFAQKPIHNNQNIQNYNGYNPTHLYSLCLSLTHKHTHTFRHASHSYHLQNLWDNSPEITVDLNKPGLQGDTTGTISYTCTLSLFLTHTHTHFGMPHTVISCKICEIIALRQQWLWTNLHFTTQGTLSYNSEVSISNLLHAGKNR